MSLQVWLPLNGDLHNQGLANVTATNNGATVDNNGKIGKCYRFGTAKSFLELPVEAMNDFTTECTVSFWLKILTRNTGWDTYFQAGLGGTAWNNYVFGFLRNNSNKCCFTVSGEAGTSSGSFVTSDMELDTWYHITLVYQTGHCLIYMDGMLYHDYSTAIVPAFNNITTITIGCANTKTNYQSNCLLNDLRIYDHALSPLEVKHLAQGLVLHYPLNRGGFGGDNLDNFSSIASNWVMESLNGSNYTDSSYGNVIKLVTNNTNQRMYHSVSNLWQSGQVYTVSFIAKADINGRTCNMSRSLADFSPSFTLTTNWERYSGKITSTATPGGGTLSFTINQSGATVYITQIKLEKGDIATPYTPALSDTLYSQMGLDNNIEYDVSGYGNNGTRVGTFSWSGDTPRYSVSTVFDGNVNINTTNPLSNPCIEFTVAGWVNLIDGYAANNGLHIINFNATYSRICISKDNSAVRVLLTDGTNAAGYSSTARASILTANVWNHYAIVFKNGELSIYINGALDSTQTAFTTVGFTTSYLGVGAYGSELAKGKVSDFRVYATALSADDVMALYKNAGYVDSNGNVYAYEITE